MESNGHFFLAALLALTIGTPAFAGAGDVPLFHDPRVVPTPAFENQPVALRLTWEGCGNQIGPPIVQRSGDTFTVQLQYYSGCGVPLSGGDVDVPLGILPRGKYVAVYVDAPFADIVIPFEVVAAEAVGVPASGVLSGIAGMMLLLVSGLIATRRRSPRRAD